MIALTIERIRMPDNIAVSIIPMITNGFITFNFSLENVC
jgi:hypothetical protein